MTEPRFDRPGAIAELLDDAVDEERVHRIWLGAQRKGREHARRHSTRRLALVALVAAVAVGVGLALGGPDRGPELRLADGRLPYAHTSSAAETIAMADGSSVRMGPGTTWVPLRNEAGRFESELAEGRIDVNVRPGGPRRWIIEAGPSRVEVVGTRFVVERSGRTVEVRVSRGRVRVEDARLEGGARVLGAGERARMTDPPAPAPAPVLAPAPAVIAVPPPRPRRDWRRLASEGDHAEAYEALGRDGLRAEARRADAAHLMLLADVARLSGHPAEAVEPLERLIDQAPSDPRAPLAAVVLGRTEMDRLNRPERARRAFERALELGVPAALRGDVEARLRRLDASR